MTPQSLTLKLSSLISIFCVAVIAIYQYIQGQKDFLFIFIFGLAVFSLTYFLTIFLVSQYTNRRIKPIYNIIQRSKTNGKRRLVEQESSANILDNLDRDVETWASSKDKEIESLKSLEQYRKDYVGNISHELKTPIFAIQGYIHTLLEDVGDKKLERKFLKRAAENTDRLNNIVSDLEMITKIEAGIEKLNKEKFEIRKLLVDVVDDLEKQAQKSEISLKVKNKEFEEYFIYADKEGVQRVLINLVNNSIKYGKKGGETMLNIFDVDEFVLIEVSDDGLGIDAQHLNHLFDRFYRVEKSRNRNIAGSGLGLSIVKHIVEAHGQDINVRSTLGEGSTFGFTMPKA